MIATLTFAQGLTTPQLVTYAPLIPRRLLRNLRANPGVDFAGEAAHRSERNGILSIILGKATDSGRAMLRLYNDAVFFCFGL